MGNRVVVFGSFVVDLTSRSKGLPVPGQTILGSSFKMGPGGKGSNQAVAAHRAGADVTLITKLGNDVFSKIALDFYASEGMNTDHILIDSEKETGVALIEVDEESGQNDIVVVPGACMNFTDADVEACIPVLDGADILLLQHEVNMDAQGQMIRSAKQRGLRIVLNPAPAQPIADDIYPLLDIVTPNETEAQVLTGVCVDSIESARTAAKVFLSRGVRNVVITMGSLGAYATDGITEQLVPRYTVNAIDTTGAGDAFNGGFVTALSEGKDLFEALRFGNATGALSVTKKGTAPAMPFRAQIDELLNS